MTSRTTRQDFLALNLVFGQQRFSVIDFGRALIFRTPCHVEHFVSLTHEFFGMPVTVETPLHL